MKRSNLFAIFTLLSLVGIAAGRINDVTIAGDSSELILLEQFGFTSAGVANVAVSEATFSSSSPDPALLGFFLVSPSNLFRALFGSIDPFAEPQNPNPNITCILSSPYIRLLFTFRDLSHPPFNSYNRSFPVAIADDYKLFFSNCAPHTVVSMTVRTVLYNSLPDGKKDFLPVGESPIPSLCFAFGIVFLIFLVIWIDYINKNRTSSHRIHYLMSGLLVAKSLNLLFRAEDQYYIKTTGTPHGWDVLFYLFQLIKGVLLFTVIILIGTGWSFLRPFLQDREKKLLMAVIPLQVVTNVASAVMAETGRFTGVWVLSMELFYVVDLLCCVAVFIPVMWSIRSLRDAAKSDGKAAKNLAKLILFKRFYAVLVGYLYSTRVLVFALTAILSYKYKWVCVAMEEGATLAFYALMFYMFRPKVKNEYFALDADEEEVAMAALKNTDFDI